MCQPTGCSAKDRHNSKASTCFIDTSITGGVIERIIIELRSDVNQRTCENVRFLCKSELKLPYQGFLATKKCDEDGGSRSCDDVDLMERAAGPDVGYSWSWSDGEDCCCGSARHENRWVVVFMIAGNIMMTRVT